LSFLAGNLEWMSKPQSTISDGFAKVVKRHREKNGLSRAALAEKAGLHQTYIGLLVVQQRSMLVVQVFLKEH